MSILFHCTFENSNEWKRKIKSKFKYKKIISINDKSEFDKVEIAIVWNLPNQILYKLPNLKIIFSLGAGVDHILNLDDYIGTPIVRIKDPLMGELMYYYVLSQILNYQVGINQYKTAQNHKIWRKEIDKMTRNVAINFTAYSSQSYFMFKLKIKDLRASTYL